MTFEKEGLATLIIVLLGASSLLYWVSYSECEQQAVSFNSYRYTVIAGCMVESNGKWLPLKNVHSFEQIGE